MAESVSSVPGLAKNLLGANEAAGGLGTWAKHGSDYTFTFKKFLMADGTLVGLAGGPGHRVGRTRPRPLRTPRRGSTTLPGSRWARP